MNEHSVRKIHILVCSEGLFWMSWTSVLQNTRNALKLNRRWKSRCYKLVLCVIKLKEYMNQALQHQILRNLSTYLT